MYYVCKHNKKGCPARGKIKIFDVFRLTIDHAWHEPDPLCKTKRILHLQLKSLMAKRLVKPFDAFTHIRIQHIMNR